jgi:hypothetical protein
MGKDNWLVKKEGPEPLLAKKTKAYPEWERANVSYSHWLSGRTAEEIEKFTGVALVEVEKDIAHIESVLPSKTLIANNNTRQRILLQRTQAKAYADKLQDALTTDVAAYLKAGLNPTTPLKEYREAVGMTEKPGALNIQVNQQTNVTTGVSRTEDIIRSVMNKMHQKEDEPPIIDVEAEEAEAV